VTRPLRIYIDTSVVGGVFDDEFSDVTRIFFDQARRGNFILLISNLLIEELTEAPEQVRIYLSNFPREYMEELRRDQEARELRDAYLSAGVLGKSSIDDAFHVALATTARADLIVSWNFHHFVNIEKIRGFNAVNLQHGYNLMDIRSPREVIHHEDE